MRSIPSHIRTPLLLFFGLFASYLALSPATIEGMGYTGEEMRSADRMVTILDAWRKGVHVPPMLWSRHGPLPVLFDIPFVAAGKLIFSPDILLSFEPVLFTAALCTILFLWLRRLTSPKMALFLTFAGAFGTMIWPYAYIGLEPKQSLFVLLAAYLALNEDIRGWRRAIPFALACALGISLKSTGLVLVPPIAYLVYFQFRKDWRTRRSEIATVLVISGFLFFVNGFFRSYFWAAFGISGSQTLKSLLAEPSILRMFTAAMGTLASPQKGLLVYAPVLLVALYLLPRVLRTHRPLAIFVLLLLACMVGELSMLITFADEVWGSRYMHTAILPLLIVIGAARPRFEWRRDAALLVLTAIGIPIAFLGAFYYYGQLHFATMKAGQNTLEALIGDNTWNPVTFHARLLRIWWKGGSEPALWTPAHRWMYTPPPGTPPVPPIDLRPYSQPQSFLVRVWSVPKHGTALQLFVIYLFAAFCGPLLLVRAAIGVVRGGNSPPASTPQPVPPPSPLPSGKRISHTARVTLPYGALLVSALLFYRAILFTSDTFIPFDLPLFHTPLAVFASASLHSGHFPLWDPNVYCGRPFFANVQAQNFYPPRLLTMLLVAPTPHLKLFRAMEVELIVHVWMAGVFMLWLARRLGLRGPPALLSAAAYSLGCYFASQAEHIGAIESAAWVPLVWLAIILLNEKITFPRFALLASVLALILLAGYTPGTIVIFLSAGILAVVWPLVLQKGIKQILAVAAAGVAALLLAAIQVIPSLQLSELSIGHLRYTWRGTGGGLRVAALKTLLWPNALGGFSWSTFDRRFEITNAYLYCGIVVLALAVIASVWKHSRVKLLVVGTTLLFAVWMIGDQTPIGTALFFSLPHFLRGPFYSENCMAPFSAGVSLLAGFGLQMFPLKRWGYFIVLAAVCDLIWAGSNRPMNSIRNDSGSMVLDTAINGEPSALAAVRQIVRAYPPPAPRIDGYMSEAGVWGGSALFTGAPSANGIDALSLTRLLEVRETLYRGMLWAHHPIQRLDPPILSLLNVRYLMSPSPIPDAELTRAGYALLRTFPGRYLYENPRVLPRFFFVDRLTPSQGEAESIRGIRRPGWDPAREAVVEGIPGPRTGLAPGDVRTIRYSDNEVLLQTHTTGDAFLASSEVHYPGWHAAIDGNETGIYYSDVAFRGVFVPAGDHRILFRFRPAILWYSAGITLVTLAACAAGLFLHFRRVTIRSTVRHA